MCGGEWRKKEEEAKEEGKNHGREEGGGRKAQGFSHLSFGLFASFPLTREGGREGRRERGRKKGRKRGRLITSSPTGERETGKEVGRRRSAALSFLGDA